MLEWTEKIGSDVSWVQKKYLSAKMFFLTMVVSQSVNTRTKGRESSELWVLWYKGSKSVRDERKQEMEEMKKKKREGKQEMGEMKKERENKKWEKW